MPHRRVLLIESSPRARASYTSRLAHAIVSALQEADPQWQADCLDLWDEALPPMSGATLTAKYAVFDGQALSAEEQAAWVAVEACVERFTAADLLVLAVPMWNFGIPYVLKHYIDVVTQPRLTFTWSPEEGYRSLLAPRPAIVVASNGGDYSAGSGNAAHDFHLPYLRAWLTVYMGCSVETVSIAPTSGDSETVRAVEERAHDAAMALITQL